MVAQRSLSRALVSTGSSKTSTFALCPGAGAGAGDVEEIDFGVTLQSHKSHGEMGKELKYRHNNDEDLGRPAEVHRAAEVDVSICGDDEEEIDEEDEVEVLTQEDGNELAYSRSRVQAGGGRVRDPSAFLGRSYGDDIILGSSLENGGDLDCGTFGSDGYLWRERNSSFS